MPIKPGILVCHLRFNSITRLRISKNYLSIFLSLSHFRYAYSWNYTFSFGESLISVNIFRVKSIGHCIFYFLFIFKEIIKIGICHYFVKMILSGVAYCLPFLVFLQIDFFKIHFVLLSRCGTIWYGFAFCLFLYILRACSYFGTVFRFVFFVDHFWLAEMVFCTLKNQFLNFRFFLSWYIKKLLRCSQKFWLEFTSNF